MNPPNRPRRSRAAVIALLVVTLIWGGTFVWMKAGVEAVESKLGTGQLMLGVALFMSLRFGIAAVCMLAFVPAARRGLDRASWVGGFWIGSLLFGGFLLQMFGLGDVSPGVSAFLTSLYVMFTALLTARRGVRPALIAGVVLATLGAGIIRGRPEFSFNRGELLTVGCALVFAVHILVTDRVTKRVPPLPVTFTSFVVVALASFVLLAFALAAPDAPTREALVDLCLSASFLQPVLLSALLATVLALSLMNIYQREIEPVRAAIIYAFEPIWAAAIGISVGMDEMTPYLWVGGIALLAGNLIAEIGQPPRSRELAID
jgi:drug/metabolite transporter (DMT)-like permease